VSRSVKKLGAEKTAAEKLLERDLGLPLVAKLESEGWAYFQEVAFEGKVPDLVAVKMANVQRNCITKVVFYEMKTNLGFPVIVQAAKWLKHGNESWVVVPEEKGMPSEARLMAYELCQARGIGIMTIRELSKIEKAKAARCGDDGVLSRVRIVSEAVEQDIDTTAIQAALHPEQKDFVQAGTNSGTHWGPHQRMCRDIRDMLAANDNAAELEAVARRVKKHPRTLADLVKEKRVPGVQFDGRAVAIMLRLVDVGDEDAILDERSERTRPRR
jgi:hypothetical protein